jgi:hypothetical protein
MIIKGIINEVTETVESLRLERVCARFSVKSTIGFKTNEMGTILPKISIKAPIYIIISIRILNISVESSEIGEKLLNIQQEISIVDISANTDEATEVNKKRATLDSNPFLKWNASTKSSDIITPSVANADSQSDTEYTV